MTLTATRVSGSLGAVIDGFDPRDPDADISQLRAAILEHEVVFFPGADLTEEEQLALGTRLGTPSIFPVPRLMGDTEPTMTRIVDGPDSPNVADEWHTDVTWTATPPAFALLHMELAAEIGGDTLWASATRAYETLSAPMQEFIAGLTCRHDNESFVNGLIAKTGDPNHPLVEGLRTTYPPVVHPLVRTHPETGKRALLYAGRFMKRIVELSERESASIIALLGEHVANPALHCRWRWTTGDLAIWDERATLHRAAADHFPQARAIRRLEIDGDEPFFTP